MFEFLIKSDFIEYELFWWYFPAATVTVTVIADVDASTDV